MDKTESKEMVYKAISRTEQKIMEAWVPSGGGEDRGLGVEGSFGRDASADHYER